MLRFDHEKLTACQTSIRFVVWVSDLPNHVKKNVIAASLTGSGQDFLLEIVAMVVGVDKGEFRHAEWVRRNGLR